MSPELIDNLLEGLWASSAVVLLVLLLRRPWRAAFGARFGPLLWAIVPAALLAVVLPARVVELPAMELSESIDSTIAPASRIETKTEPAVDWRSALAATWLLGSLFSASYFIRMQRRFQQRLGRTVPISGRLHSASRSDVGPAVLGLLRPRIVLPADFSRRFSTEQQALILIHEYSHLQRGDVLANALATALRCIYWFNPLLHYAATRLRHDHELASDADVLQRFPKSRRRYADTLLNAQLAVPGLPVGCLWQSSHPLKERIMMMKSPPPRPWRSRVGLAAGCLLIGSVALTTWAAQPALEISSGQSEAVARATHQVNMQLSVDGKHYSPELHFVRDRGFAVGIDEWRVEFTPDGNAQYQVKLSFRGKPIELGSASTVNDEFEFEARAEAQSPVTIRASGTIRPLTTSANDATAFPSLAQTVSIAGQGKTLRQVVEHLTSSAGVQLRGGEELDRRFPAADLDYRFEDERVRHALHALLDDRGLGFSFSAQGLRIQADGEPGYARLTTPTYPTSALDAKQAGTVLLSIHVLSDGQPGRVEVERSSGHVILDESALLAAQNWTFQPARRNDTSVDGWVKVPICFSLSEDDSACTRVDGALDTLTLRPPPSEAAATAVKG